MLDVASIVTYFINNGEGGEMKTDIAQLYGQSILGGAQGGKALLSKLNEVAASTNIVEPTLWLWDFSGVEVVSASFVREAFVSMQALLKAQRSPLLPAIANASSDVREDLQLTFKEAGRAMLVCSVTSVGEPSDVTPIGDLESYAAATFALVQARGETDAKELMASQDEANRIGHTAWNNRLANLAAVGLLVEIPQGRAKRYRALV